MNDKIPFSLLQTLKSNESTIRNIDKIDQNLDRLFQKTASMHERINNNSYKLEGLCGMVAGLGKDDLQAVPMLRRGQKSNSDMIADIRELINDINEDMIRQKELVESAYQQSN